VPAGRPPYASGVGQPAALALGQRHQNVGQGRIRAEPREQAVATIAPRSFATTVDANHGQRELAERM
jgi:hypothetical protein